VVRGAAATPAPETAVRVGVSLGPEAGLVIAGQQ
jgi:hypothetical protein